MSNAARIPRRRGFVLSKKGARRPDDHGITVRVDKYALGVDYPGPDGWWFRVDMRPVHGVVVPVKVYRPESMTEYETRIRASNTKTRLKKAVKKEIETLPFHDTEKED